jgi:hypothetical protein
MKRLLLSAGILTIAAAACARPIPVDGVSAAIVAPATDSAAEPPIVQVRDYWRSSTVTVVAWDPDEAAIGLRTAVTRRGELAGGLRAGDHRLYMTPLYARDMGGFRHSYVIPGQPLLGAGTQRDLYTCFFGTECSPMVTVGVRVPDSLLRANRDSLVVNFTPGVRDQWTITLRRELIDAYLAKVDSLIADVKIAAQK